VTDALKTAILAAADAIDEARPELGRLDGAAGDGDHGMTMSIGARNVRRRFAGLPAGASAADLLRQVALAMADVGGAIGPLYSTGLTAMALELESLESAEGGSSGGSGSASGSASSGSASSGSASSVEVALLRRVAEAAEEAVVALGHAQPGDKTVIDALDPVVGALRDAEAGHLDLGSAIESAAGAAEAGASGTADMVARIGRASRLGERSRGLPDAGATSLAIIVRAVADAYPRPGSGNS
jgi:dihydroxyacetone kinase-like protein